MESLKQIPITDKKTSGEKSGLGDCGILGDFHLTGKMVIYILEMWAKINGRKLIMNRGVARVVPTMVGGSWKPIIAMIPKKIVLKPV